MKVFEQYLSFIKTHEAHPFEYKKHKMTYRLFGHGQQVMLIMMGSSMFPSEAYLKIIEPLAEKERILLVDYPYTIQTINELVDLIKALIDDLGFEKITIFGASHGGSFAQAFAYRYPKATDKLILYNTLTHSDHMNESSKQILSDVMAVIKELEELRKVMPLDSVKGVFLNQVEAAISDESEIDLFEYMIDKYTEADEQLQMRLIKSFITTYTFSSDDFNSLEGRVLILYGHDQDPFGGSELIETLVELFKEPQLEFIESDRFSLIIDAHDLIEKVDAFMKEPQI